MMTAQQRMYHSCEKLVEYHSVVTNESWDIENTWYPLVSDSAPVFGYRFCLATSSFGLDDPNTKAILSIS